MKVTASDIEGSQVVLDMEIEPERVDKAMDRAYRRVASRVNVPGFRRGKAPRVLVERVVGRETLMNEALEILLPEAYQEAVRETGIEPVDNPKLDVVSAEPLSVRATVPVRPKVVLGDYRAIRQSLETTETPEERVDSTIESLRQSRAQWVPVEREANVGDRLTTNLVARAGDVTLLDNRELQLALDPERQLIAPGVVEQLVGMKAGDHKSFEVTLPDDFPEKELAGQVATIEATAVDVKEKQVPELTDDLAQSLGDFPTVEDLRKAVRQELEEQARLRAQRNLEESVIGAVVDQAQVEPPPVWVEEQADAVRKSTEQGLGREGLTYEQFLRFTNRTEESYKDELLSSARQQLRRTLVLDAVADAEGIEVSDDEVDAALKQATDAQEGKADAAAEDGRTRESLRSRLRERKTVARLVEISEGKADDEQKSDQTGSPTEQSQPEEEE